VLVALSGASIAPPFSVLISVIDGPTNAHIPDSLLSVSSTEDIRSVVHPRSLLCVVRVRVRLDPRLY